MKILCDLNFLWELPYSWAKNCEIVSHSVRYAMYALEPLKDVWILIPVIGESQITGYRWITNT